MRNLEESMPPLNKDDKFTPKQSLNPTEKENIIVKMALRYIMGNGKSMYSTEKENPIMKMALRNTMENGNILNATEKENPITEMVLRSLMVSGQQANPKAVNLLSD